MVLKRQKQEEAPAGRPRLQDTLQIDALVDSVPSARTQDPGVRGFGHDDPALGRGSGAEKATMKGHVGVSGRSPLARMARPWPLGVWTPTIRLWDVASGRRRLPSRGTRSMYGLWPSVRMARLWPPGGRTRRSGSGTCQRQGDGIPQGADGGPLLRGLQSGWQALASGSDDGRLRLWTWPSGKRKVALGGHPSSVICLAFSRMVKTLASGVRLPRSGSGLPAKEKAALGVHGAVRSVAFSPDGKTWPPGSGPR